MKQIFKKYIFFLLIFIASLFIASDVFALYVGEGMGYDYYDYDNQIKLNGAISKSGGGTYPYYLYEHYIRYKGENYGKIFCIDPGRPSGGSNADLKVGEVLDQDEPFDAVVLAILSDTNYSAIQRLIAVRVFTALNGKLSTKDTKINYIREYATSNSAIIWASESSVQEYTKILFDQKEATKEAILEYPNTKLYREFDSKNVLNTNHGDIKKAKELFQKALKYGAKVAEAKKNGVSYTKSVTFTTPTFVNVDPEVVLEGGYSKSTKIITFSATFNNFDDGSAVSISVTPDANGKVTLNNIEYLDPTDNTTWKPYSSAVLPTLLKNNKSLKVNFRTSVTAKIPTDNLSSTSTLKFNYTIRANYTDDKVLTGALIINKKTTNPLTQRYYYYETDTNKHDPVTSSLTWNLLPDYCASAIPDMSDTAKFKSYLKICCRGENATNFNISDECNKAVDAEKTDEGKERVRSTNNWCQKKQLYCDVCNGTVSVPQKCSELGTGDVPKCEDNADAIIKDNDNIKLCVLDYSDEADNDYKLTKDDKVANNRYCSVYCKEDYKISLPLGRWVNSGRTFTVGINLNATKTCYTDLINYNQFITDIGAAKTELDKNINDPTARKNYSNILNEYMTCAKAEWTSGYEDWNQDTTKLKPSITLSYDEDQYMQSLFNNSKVQFVIGKNSKGSTFNLSNENKWLCGGTNTAVDVDDYYNECKNGTAVNKSEDQAYTQLDNYYDPSSFAKTSIKVPLTRYAKKASFASAVYVPKDNLYTKVGSGTISLSGEEYEKLVADMNVNGEQVTNAGKLPIALRRQYGIYNFNVYFAGIGEFFNQNAGGRLIGDKNSVALKNGDTTFKGEYMCSYIVNCPECKLSCVNDPEKGIFCNPGEKKCTDGTCGDTCITCRNTPFCVDCNDNIGMFIARQISLTNVNPSDRKLGINLSDLKGRTAVNAINSNGESIYNNKEGKAAYTITLTPKETRMLQSYNNIKVSSGGYASFDDFECYPYSTKVDKNSDTYAKLKENDYIVCESKLLRGANVSGYEFKNVEITDSGNVSWIEACDKETKSLCIIGGFYGPAYK